ncbi:unnamed protein product [Ectocarpus fasciculatus]
MRRCAGGEAADLAGEPKGMGGALAHRAHFGHSLWLMTEVRPDLLQRTFSDPQRWGLTSWVLEGVSGRPRWVSDQNWLHRRGHEYPWKGKA